MGRREIRMATGRSEGAVRQALRRLESAGMVDVRRGHPVQLAHGDHFMWAALDEWLLDMGVDHRGALIRYQHNEQRVAYQRQLRLLPPEAAVAPTSGDEGFRSDAS